MTETLIAFHGREDLKVGILAELARHREADKLIQGYGYWSDGKGCAVGCTLQSFCVVEQREACDDMDHADHTLYQRYLGVPTALARIEDGIFEGLPKADAQQWPERFLTAIRPGADLSMVVPRFLYWLLTDPDGGVQAGVARRPQIGPAVAGVSALYDRWLAGAKPSDTEWREARSAAAAGAAYAAYAAADAAAAAYADTYADAAAAADAAAYAYADAYAYAAARYRSRQRQADKLIEFLEAV